MNKIFYEFITWILFLFLNKCKLKNKNNIFESIEFYCDEENLLNEKILFNEFNNQKIDNKPIIFYKIKND